jgi:hypothetical protein
LTLLTLGRNLTSGEREIGVQTGCDEVCSQAIDGRKFDSLHPQGDGGVDIDSLVIDK